MQTTKTLNTKIKVREQANLWLFATGKGVSILGSSIYSFAIGLYVLNLTGSALNYATTLMLSVIPMILISPLAGVLADRLPKKNMVVGMDIASGVLFFFLAIYASNAPLSLGLIYISTILLNVFTTFFGITIEAAKPRLVSPNRLVRINTLGKLIDSSASIVGPMLGGVVYAFIDIRAFMLFNSVSFLFSAFTECFIDYDFNLLNTNANGYKEIPPDATKTLYKQSSWNRLKEDLLIGWHAFRSSKAIIELFFVFVSLNFVLGFSVNVPGPYIINTILKLPSSAFGLINGLFPVGLIVGTLTVEKLMRIVSYKKLLYGMNAFIAVLAMAIGLPALTLDFMFPSNVYVVFYATLHLCMGVSIAYVDVPLMTLLQREVPGEHLGRVLSIVMSLVKVVLPIALLISGALINQLPIVMIPILGGSVPLLYSLSRLKEKPNKA